MKKVVENILANLNDRSGFDNWWGGIDDEIQQEIKDEMEEVLLKANLKGDGNEK